MGVGPAVRLIPYLQQQPKRYRAVFQLGRSSDSGDLEGDVSDHPHLPSPSLEQLQASARQLVGSIEQTPPAHSAIWVDGQRAYKRVRAGETVEMPTRVVQIDSLEITRYDYPEMEFDTVCGSGTYIRSLGVDLARGAGSVAVMSYLRRLAVGTFQVGDAISLKRLREDDLSTMLVPCIEGIEHLPRIEVDSQESRRLGHGLCLDAERFPSQPEDERDVAMTELAAITASGQLRAILRWKHEAWCPYKVFPVDEEATQ